MQKPKPTDTELLDWMIFYCGTVVCSRDGEDCWVTWYSKDEEAEMMQTPIMGDAREAIVKAMEIEETIY
jgi:hypothetical protein